MMSGLSGAGLWSRISFSWVGPLINEGCVRVLEEPDAKFLLTPADDAPHLAEQFQQRLSEVKAHEKRGRTIYPAFLKIYWPSFVVHSLWVLIEIFVRLTSPVALREFLRWLTAEDEGRDEEQWKGWLLALAISSSGAAMTLIHHQFFWVGMRMGFRMRQQAVAAIHRKVLRLNSAGLMAANTGLVVNLVSNDVRRFDDAMPFWLFIWAGPLELVGVLVLVALELGIVPAIAGVSTTLMVIPLQAMLVRYIGGLRRNTAMYTDERVRVEGEAISGALAMKMLGWEEPLYNLASHVRQKEMSFQQKMARIRACNMALQFCITPIVSFVTFSVARKVHGSLNVPSVFYALSLLHLPKLYMVNFFVLGVQYLTELRVSIQRIEAFLSLSEPPLPIQSDESQHLPNGYVSMEGADYDWQRTGGRDPSTSRHSIHQEKEGNASDGGPASGSAAKEHEMAVGPGQKGRKEVSATGEGPPSSELPLQRLTLNGIRFELKPGELLGICGEVGSGKSSILAALLGELQPLQPEGGPRLKGSVAYCSQVPWIVAASLRDNILFGQPLEQERYQEVVKACALTQDLEELPAGDATELGERGINLSGGQKARVALARAAYSQADIQLLDDPLSAVDPRVGRVLFDLCIGPRGLMAGSTRVLVTHQRQYLPQCDRILVLRGGSTLAMGTWKEVAALELPELTHGAAAVHLEDEEENQEEEEEEEESGDEVDDETATGMGGNPLVVVNSGGDAGGRHIGIVERRKEQQQDLGEGRLDTPGTEASQAPVSRVAQRASFSEDCEEWSLSRERTQVPDVNRNSSLRLRIGHVSFLRKLSRSWSIIDRATSGSRSGKVGEAGRQGDSVNDRTGQLVRSEQRSVGGVSWSVYLDYCRQMGVPVVVLLVALLLAGQGTFLGSEWWLSLWAYADESNQGDRKWLWVYALLTGIVIVVALLRSGVFFESTIYAATRIHNAMAHRVFRAPLSFFHVNPAGRVLNRFSNDQGRVDDQLPLVLFDALQTGFLVLGAIVLVSIAVPVILPVFIPLAGFFYYYRNRYIITSREVKRLEAITRSPVYASFSATLKGLPTIRAYGAQERFHQEFLSMMSINGTWWFAFISTARWIGFRLDVVASVMLAAAALLAMAARGIVAPEILGLALTHVLQMTGMLQWWVRQTAEVENTMTSVERMLEYTRLEQEPPTVAEGGGTPPPGWPRNGAITYHHVTARYRPGLPAVLKDLTFDVAASSTCGVVGRTGSGKSSLMLTLFRLIDVTEGAIFLDGLDISTIGFDGLRSQLAIIPQDPVLFSGTLRSNLDPWNHYNDHRLWEVLAAVQLKSAVATAGGLDTKMVECGDNLSVGQRQMFCLARALLQDAKVLALDEATANVDRATDALIQDTLRDFVKSEHSRANGRVLMVIAHRIDTILDCDKLLVLSNGVLVEEGSPRDLTGKEGGLFRRMVEASKAQHRTILPG